jgi:hypothetical protein
MEGVLRHQGYLPGAVARMAHSPQALNGFLQMSALFETTTLRPVEREVHVMTDTQPTDAQPFSRVISSEDGGTSYSNGQLDRSSQKVSEGVPPMLAGPVPACGDAIYLCRGAYDSTPHPTPRRQWVIMLRGTIRVTVTDGESREFSPGELLLLEDTTATGHVTEGIGDPPFEGLFLPSPD